jgi:hypothetical protein
MKDTVIITFLIIVFFIDSYFVGEWIGTFLSEDYQNGLVLFLVGIMVSLFCVLIVSLIIILYKHFTNSF